MASPQLIFVRNLLSSKIIWAQLISLVASLASMAGVHVLDDQASQQEAIGFIDFFATTLLRWWFPTGPVALAAPFVTPAAVEVHPGSNDVHVAEAQPPTPLNPEGTIATVRVLPTVPGAEVAPAPPPTPA